MWRKSHWLSYLLHSAAFTCAEERSLWIFQDNWSRICYFSHFKPPWVMSFARLRENTVFLITEKWPISRLGQLKSFKTYGDEFKRTCFCLGGDLIKKGAFVLQRRDSSYLDPRSPGQTQARVTWDALLLTLIILWLLDRLRLQSCLSDVIEYSFKAESKKYCFLPALVVTRSLFMRNEYWKPLERFICLHLSHPYHRILENKTGLL